jgi:pseudaminic acid synthase
MSQTSFFEEGKTFIIAEMSGNHGGNLERALEIVRQAKIVGADAVKLQTYRADTITLNSRKEDFMIPGDSPWSDSKTLFSLYEQAFTPWEWHEALFQEAKKVGILLFSSPFDVTAVDLLESFNVPLYKIASPEITDIPLLEYVASKKKPVIISTGVANVEDIELAVKTLKSGGAKEVVILKCTSAYPAPASSINLRTMVDIGKRFSCKFGLSDHSLGSAVPVAAATLGASLIEKHFTLDQEDDSVDSFFSLDVEGFRKMIEDIRSAEASLGEVTYEIDAEAKKNFWARRSLYVAAEIKKGDVVTPASIKSVRPHYGAHPKHYRDLIGKRAKKDLEYGDRARLEDFE